MTSPFPALAAPVDLAGRLGVAVPGDGSSELAKWQAALVDASNAVRDAIGQPVTPGTATVAVEVNGSGHALIPLSPVVEILQVLDPAGLALASDGSDYRNDGQRLTVYRGYGGRSQFFTVTVQHGWDPIPGEILRWVFILAAAQVRSASRGNLGMTGGVTSVAIDDGKVTYADAGQIPDRVQVRLRAMYGGEQ